MKLISTSGRGGRERVAALLARRNAAYERALPAAKRIVEGVRKGGDAALRRYAAKFDGNSQPSLRISPEEMQDALDTLSPTVERALRTAAKNIRAFAEHQRPKDWNFAPASGVVVGQRIRPISNVGCYVPSGRYPLPSTLLMTAIPAQVAGVLRIVVVSPRPAQETLAAAAMLGITEFYRLGGAHAIAALAYGTKTIGRVDKIVGPGNAFVTAAKRLVAFDCAIDMLAGPTEIVVTSDAGNPDEISSDLVAQAEHDPDAQAIFITTNADLASAVIADVRQRTRSNKIAAESIARNGLAIIASSIEEARDLTNAIAPEHLTVDATEDLAWIKNAGSVFIGRSSAQPLGDYVSGPNHTLPTCGLARTRGGLSVMDFLKVITVQEYTPEGLRRLGPAAITLAEAEGLLGHAEAIRTRQEGSMNNATITVPQPRDLIRRMKDYHPPLGDRGGLRLDFNENTFACSPRVLDTLARVSRAELTMYPEREHVERIVADRLGLEPAQALLTNGVDEAIHVLCQTYLGPGDEMLLPVPTYSMYAVYGSGTDATLVEVPAEANFRFPLEALLAKITPATKLIAIANPNSPTGQVVSREAILEILEAAPHSAVLVDEAYFHFHGQTVMDLIGRAPNLIVARTFSKAYGLAGLRYGLLAAPAEQMQWLRRVISPYSVNSLALACLPAALDDQPYIDWYVSEVLKARAEFAAALDRIAVPYWPSEANFVLTRIGAKHAEFAKAMRNRGVLVRDRSADPGCDGCVRITIGTREQTAQGATVMEQALKEIGWTGDAK